jgi:hypothetical protein
VLFEGIFNGDPDPIELLRGAGAANGHGEGAVRELIARAQMQRTPQVSRA